jgi:hypothetical protein
MKSRYNNFIIHRASKFIESSDLPILVDKSGQTTVFIVEDVFAKEDIKWQDILQKKSKARRKKGSKRAKKKGRRNRKSDKKRDACYYKVRRRYKKWPSAYASGALVQCRKKGAKNWGNSKKK